MIKHSAQTVLATIALSAMLSSCFAGENNESTCFGTPENGRLENGWKLPANGRNFTSYSAAGVALGRTYVHSKVHRAVVNAYVFLEKSRPGTVYVYVYGETGKESGGPFKPHKTHKNGLSVDFMMPVLDEEKNSVPLPGSALNKYGYDIEFSKLGKYDDLAIDFDAMADHLIALDKAAREQGISIRRVIFDNDLQLLLFKSRRGAELKRLVPFSKMTPWVRHDEHYHVDFAVACKK